MIPSLIQGLRLLFLPLLWLALLIQPVPALLRTASAPGASIHGYSFRNDVSGNLSEEDAIKTLEPRAGVGPAAAQLCLCGVGFFHAGLDWVIIAGDVGDGEFGSIMGCLPFLTPGMLKAGKIPQPERTQRSPPAEPERLAG